MATQLMQGEQRIALARQHWLVVAPAFLVLAVALAAGLAILVAFPTVVGGHDITGVKRIVALVLMIATALWTLGEFLRWRFVTYLLTDRRIVLERGVISRVTESISLDRVQNTVIKRPLGDRLIGAGNIEIESAGRDGVEELHRVPRAQSFYNEILQAIEGMRAGGGAAPPRPADV
jgi:uncharacterized membrane protein YdbT with pleckstrin-like domain